jgi:type I restriction enzyme S subunit
VVPPLAEQTCIAEFLDRETGKIDELVAEQHRLMELLKEKRQAVISHAVTKGLNPRAPMKPAGIEWLGDVPEQWSVVAAKRVSNVFVPQRNKPELNGESTGVGWVTMEQMGEEEIGTTNLWVSDAAAQQAGSRILKAGAVIASCVGTFGVASLNPADVIINQQLQAFIPSERINGRYLRHCVASAGSYFEQVGTAATIIYVNQQGFENLPLPLPPLPEQEAIVEFIAYELCEIDNLAAEAQKAIDLLQERRTALISAAVTGQIDVRKLAAA